MGVCLDGQSCPILVAFFAARVGVLHLPLNVHPLNENALAGCPILAAFFAARVGVYTSSPERSSSKRKCSRLKLALYEVSEQYAYHAGDD